MKTNSTNEYINQLKSEGILNPVLTSRGNNANKGTWMHPKLFIDFAMWVSVEFKSKVIDYVLDGLIKSRHDAGDYYNEMCAQILDTYVSVHGRKPPAVIYVNEAKLIRNIANLDTTNRNYMNESDLNKLTFLQKANSELIKDCIGKESRIRQLEYISKIMNR